MADTDAQLLPNLLKLNYLLNSTATKCLREMFIKEWKVCTNTCWENTASNGHFFIHNHGLKLYQQGQQLQKELMKSGNLARWDIPLLCAAVRLFPSSMGKLQTVDRNKCLKILAEEEKKLEQHGTTDMADDLFEIVWTNVTEKLLKLGVPSKTLNESRNILSANVDLDESHQTQNCSKPNLTKAVQLKDDGNGMFKAKKYTQAINKYSDAIQLPSLPLDVLAALYSNRSIAYYKVEDFESAKSDAKGAVLVHPVWSKGYFRLAAAYEALSKFPKALKNYKLALTLNPEDGTVKKSIERLSVIIYQRSREERFYPESWGNAHEAARDQIGVNVSAARLEDMQRLSVAWGLASGLCSEGYDYLHGIGRKQDFAQAAKYFGQAASQGNAEGLFYLAMLTMEGKGVRRNFEEAVRLLRQAASQENIITSEDRTTPNIGKADAEHTLGQLYESGIGVQQDLNTAVKWYLEGIKHSSGPSCNNLAMLYRKGEGVPYDMEMAFALWKLGAYYCDSPCAGNLAIEYFGVGDSKNGWKWFDFAAALGCTSIIDRRAEFSGIFGSNPNVLFDKKQFEEELKIEVLTGHAKHLLCPDEEIYSRQNYAKEISGLLNNFPGGPPLCPYKTAIVRLHRAGFKATAQGKRVGKRYTAIPGSLSASKGNKELLELIPIFFEDMVTTKDHIYEGFVIKLTIIEDPITDLPAIPLIVEDEKKKAHRAYIFNYGQKKKKIEETLGYGCKISIMNPYLRIAADSLAAIRVDDPTAIVFHPHLREKNRCRFCGKGEISVKCQKCKRCSYCSKKCLEDDANILDHEYICEERPEN